MSRFIETIQFSNGELQNLKYHNNRFNNCRREFFGIKKNIDLGEIIKAESFITTKTYRITVLFSENIDNISSIEYKRKPINSLKFVESPADFDYSHKYADRSEIERLLLHKQGCDDIIILKNNLITDISFANIVFYDGSKYLTPALPLLKGTKRQKLIDEKRLSEVEIRKNDIHLFKYCGIINAMLDAEDYKIEMRNIF